MSPLMLDEKLSGENAEKQASSYVVGGLRFDAINRTLKCIIYPLTVPFLSIYFTEIHKCTTRWILRFSVQHQHQRQAGKGPLSDKEKVVRQTRLSRLTHPVQLFERVTSICAGWEGYVINFRILQNREYEVIYVFFFEPFPRHVSTHERPFCKLGCTLMSLLFFLQPQLSPKPHNCRALPPKSHAKCTLIRWQRHHSAPHRSSRSLSSSLLSLLSPSCLLEGIGSGTLSQVTTQLTAEECT